MLPLSYGAIYKTPRGHEPPEETELSDDTDYPNLNSRDYAKLRLNRKVRMHNAWECISISTPESEPQGNIAICCNKLSGRQWSSSFWGFEKSEFVKNRDTAVDPNNAVFKVECSSLVNCMEFSSANILLVAFNSGIFQVWSTHSEVRSAHNPYRMFLIGEKRQHLKPISCLARFKTNHHKAATGCRNGTIRLWNTGCADLISTHGYRFAHRDSITSLSSCPSNENAFITCSMDKSCILWDDRASRPATALCDNHNVRLKDVTYSSKPDNLVYLGDESGYIITLDLRKPRELINKSQYFDRPIRKISPNGDNLAVIADTNVVKVSNCSTHAVLYENSDSYNFVRNCAWLSSTELLTVDFDGKMQSHCLKKL